MKRPLLKKGHPESLCVERMHAAVSGLKVLDVANAESGGILKGYQPDPFSAFVEFSINHSLPVVAGPVVSGNYLGYHPRTIRESYDSLLWKQMNLLHAVRKYDPENIPADRIVGCAIMVGFPEGDWSAIPEQAAQAPCMKCVATVFKQAEGVDWMLGEHQSGVRPWSVSIEVGYDLSEAAMWLARGRLLTPLLEMSDEMWASVSRNPQTGRLLFGKYRGEQMVICPGGSGGRIQYQGVGFTPDPGEREATIDEVRCQRLTLPGGTVAVPPSQVRLASLRGGVQWVDGNGSRTHARVLDIATSGAVRLGLDLRQATPANPVLRVRTAGGAILLRSLSSVQPA